MASNPLTHLPLASTHRTSIAFFLLIITIFVVPFLSLSSTSELIPSATLLPSIAYTLWNSLLDILSSSPFYFFLLNFLVVALVFLSGVLHPSSSGRESDGLQEGDLHQRGLHNYSTAAQIIHERLALDELYESQASSLIPYLNITESSRTYVAGDGMIGNGYSDDDETHIDKGKQVMANPIDSFLHARPALSDGDVSDSMDNGSRSSRMDATEEFFLTGGMVEDHDSEMKKISPVSSVVVKNEIAHPHDIHGKDIQVYDRNLHPESNAEANVDVDTDARRERTKDTAAVINIDNKDGNDVNHDEDSNDVIQDGGDDHVDDSNDVNHDEDSNDVIQDGGNVHIDHKCNGIEVEAEGEGDGKRRRQRIARTPSEPMIAGKIHSQQREMNVGAELGEDEDGRGRCMSLERVEWLGVEKQKEKAGEEEMMNMSREELNERASAFISAFRKKLVSTAIDDLSGHM